MDEAICNDKILPTNECSNDNLTVQTNTGVDNHATGIQSYSSAAARNTQTDQYNYLCTF